MWLLSPTKKKQEISLYSPVRKIKGPDVILQLLSADNRSNIIGVKKMNLLAFLITDQLKKIYYYSYIPFEFRSSGLFPEDSDIMDILLFLENIELISLNEYNDSTNTYSITDKGQRFVEQVTIPKNIGKVYDIIKDVKIKFNHLENKEILSGIDEIEITKEFKIKYNI